MFGAGQYRAHHRRFPLFLSPAVYLNANVTEILLNATGTTIEAMRVAMLDGERLIIKAKQFVLVCGGMENARLLLVSRDVQSHSIGNQHDVVGRYFYTAPGISPWTAGG